MLLYVGSTVFICYLSFGMRFSGLQVPVWNALFWIILLFTAVNAIAKSFMQENRGRLLYFYSLVSPQGVILAKIAYNAALMLVLALLCFLFYAVVIGNPVQDVPMFLLSILLGAIGFFYFLNHDFGNCRQGGQQQRVDGRAEFSGYCAHAFNAHEAFQKCHRWPGPDI